ncbi:MAG: hypothetical protein AAGD25_11610 [Cyanobacteria bacterium P01_F01_bin.150]
MSIKRWQKVLAPLFLSVLLLVSGCGSGPAPSPYDQVQQETSGSQAPAVAGEAVQGSNFNALFPDAADGFDVVPSQEKQGFAEYKLKKDGTTMAMLSINDTVSNPDAAAKFANSDRSVAGYPAVDIGSKQTAILVGDRFQVKVQSRDDAFAKGDREAWLGKFNLRGLANLSP